MTHRPTAAQAMAGLLALACLGALGCDRHSPYRIGVVLNVDGIRSARLSAEDVNFRGGIDGHPLEVVAELNGGTDAGPALATAERLASDPTILAVVGHTNSGASLAASQIYNAHHILQIAPTSSSPLYSSAGPYSFRLVGSDEYQGRFIADQVLLRARRPRTALVYVNDDYGRPLHSILLDRLRAGGIVPVIVIPYVEAESSGVVEVVAALARARPDLLVWIGRSQQYAVIEASLAKALPTLDVIASDGFGSSDDSIATPVHGRGSLKYVRLFDPNRQDTAYQRLQAQSVRGGWGEPSDQAVLAYDAVSLIAAALRRVGPHREAIRTWMAAVGRTDSAFAGLSGPIAFPRGGDRTPQYFLEPVLRLYPHP
jgi:branched-chain amino acid transport system substrate-binding protein